MFHIQIIIFRRQGPVILRLVYRLVKASRWPLLILGWPVQRPRWQWHWFPNRFKSVIWKRLGVGISNLVWRLWSCLSKLLHFYDESDIRTYNDVYSQSVGSEARDELAEIFRNDLVDFSFKMLIQNLATSVPIEILIDISSKM